jgi:hypothetical protein
LLTRGKASKPGDPAARPPQQHLLKFAKGVRHANQDYAPYRKRSETNHPGDQVVSMANMATFFLKSGDQSL